MFIDSWLKYQLFIFFLDNLRDIVSFFGTIKLLFPGLAQTFELRMNPFNLFLSQTELFEDYQIFDCHHLVNDVLHGVSFVFVDACSDVSKGLL